jgi:hypothetical protein
VAAAFGGCSFKRDAIAAHFGWHAGPNSAQAYLPRARHPTNHLG